MDPQFWHEQWDHNQIGFHQSIIHPFLVQFWPVLGLGTGQIFVPLCGKSLDMVWLRDQGHSILGIELSPFGTLRFFQGASSASLPP